MLITRGRELPRLVLALSTFDRVIEALSALIGLLLLVIPLTYYDELPDRIPQQYNAAGEVDIYGPKYMLWVLAGTGIALYGFLTFLCGRPHWFNYPVKITPENAKRQYRLATRWLRSMKLGVMLLVFYIVWATIRNARGEASGLSSALIFIVIGVNAALTAVYLARATRQ